MKKTYIIPATEISQGVVEEMIAASITGIGGDSGLGLGDDDIPDYADVREFDEDDLDW